MEAPMVQRPDPPRLDVKESFETTRFGRSCLIEAYGRLVPIRRASARRVEPDDRRPATVATSRCGGEHV